MEKIKSLVSGHKKSEDATHDTPTSSTAPTGAQYDSQSRSTPIYDQMTGSHGDHSASTTHPSTTGASASARQTSPSTGLGHTEHSHGTGFSDSSRPGANPIGAGHIHEGISEASIKSGVIGFGTGERQEHAALSSHNPEAGLNRNQILGGGNTGTGPVPRDAAEQPSTLKQALPLSGNSASDQPHSNTGNTLGSTTQSSTTQQPFEQSLRQESFTKDTDRSFPLTGGVASKHDPSAKHSSNHHTTLIHHPTEHHTSSTQYPTQQTSSTHHPITTEREPGTKEREIAARNGHGREGLAAAAAATTALGGASALSQSHQRDVPSQVQDARQATHGNQPLTTSNTSPVTSTTSHTTQSRHPEALAAATAAASKYSNSSSSNHGQGIGVQDNSFASTSRASDTISSSRQPRDTGIVDGGRPPGGRSISYRHVPGGFPTPTPDESKTFLYYKDEVVPEPGADGPILSGAELRQGLHSGQHDPVHTAQSSRDPAIASGVAGGLASSHEPHQTPEHYGDTTRSGTSTTEPHNNNLLNKLDPRVKDASSSQHEPSSTSGAPIASSTATSGPSGQHELRHTGSLEQPRPKSSDLSEDHHHGRDAAIAGGIGAGAAGLGYAATWDRDAPNVGSNTMPQESSPYSSHKLDPRVLGDKGKLEEQRYNPQVKAEHSSHHTPQTATAAGVSTSTHGHQPNTTDIGTSLEGPVHKSSLLNKLDPRVKDTSSKTSEGAQDTTTSTKHSESQHHLGHDAALVGAGGATAVGARQALQRNDTPGTGTFVLPEQQTSSTTGPAAPSTTAAPQHGNTSEPLSSSTTSNPQESSHTSAPLSSSTTHASETGSASKGKSSYDTYHGPLTTDGQPFYGAAGAPAPIADNRPQQPTSASSTTAPVSQTQDTQHHYGRDAGVAGAGATTAGGLAYGSQHDNKNDSVPISSTTGQHSSNVAGNTTGPHQSDTLNRADPRVDEKAGHQGQHHLGRDAAVIGGSGAAGYGAYEATQAYGDHRSTQPGASMNEQRYDPTAAGAHAPNPVQASGHYDYNNKNTSRNVALGSGAALGAGALGGAAYAGSKHADNTQHVPTSSTHPLSSSAQPAPVTQSQLTQGTFGQPAHAPSATSTNYPTQGTIAPQNTQSTLPGSTHNRYDSIQDPRDKDHVKRDAAVLGTAGAGAAGGAAYGYSQHQDAERERARMEKEQQERLKKEQHDHEKEQHKLDKEHTKQEKEAHKLDKEQHKHEKEAHKHDKAVAAAEKDQHKHEKEQEKEAHRLEKEREKEAARLEKEREKEVEPEKEKKHGILGFLHRDKSKKEKRSSAESSPRQSSEFDNKRHSKEYAAGGAALGAGTTAAAYENDSNDPNSPRWKGKNRLHKDPPKGHPAREALEHHEMGDVSGKREHVGVDGPIGDPNAISGQQETRSGVYGAQPLSQVHEHDIKIEPHTGLPMNVGRYGDGAGGTDARTTVEGQHHVPGAEGQTATDWSEVKKKDTIY